MRWVRNAHPEWDRDQVSAEVSQITNIPVEHIRDQPGEPLTATEDIEAKGTELELFYNPTEFWTMRLNFARAEAINGRIAPEITQYIAQQLPIWKNIIDPETGQNWWTSTAYGADSFGMTISAQESFRASVMSKLDPAVANEGKSRPQVRKYRANLLTRCRLDGLLDHRILRRFEIGAGLRWESKGAIGYYGVQQLPDIVTQLDVNRPIYDHGHLYVDTFLAYRTRLFGDRVGATFQLNVRNATESGRLQPIAAYPDGTPNAFRIIDPRQFILTVTFDL
jgi:hypothetical protein